jgi:hypothetical protein
LEGMTTREKAEQVLKGLPEEQVPVALEALEAVERDARVLRVLRERDPGKSERELMEDLAVIKEGDEAIEWIGERFADGTPPTTTWSRWREAGAEAIVSGDKDLLDHAGELEPKAINAREACELLGLL